MRKFVFTAAMVVLPAVWMFVAEANAHDRHHHGWNRGHHHHGYHHKIFYSPPQAAPFNPPDYEHYWREPWPFDRHYPKGSLFRYLFQDP